ncbi:hypothetical protein ACJMK2_007972 [Sinanodonta woodiana]|uniref:Phosphatidylinositol-4,5-bisphosphate 3-kinase n=1 Tax=Sinanodonta woodiana TaxID=1069815 RepID=A0ABD3VK44_SINWO
MVHSLMLSVHFFLCLPLLLPPWTLSCIHCKKVQTDHSSLSDTESEYLDSLLHNCEVKRRCFQENGDNSARYGATFNTDPLINLRLLDLPLYLPILTLTLPMQKRQSLQLHTIASLEIKNFRREVGTMCKEIALERQRLPKMERLLVYYPPVLDINSDLPMPVADIINNAKTFLIKVYIYYPGEEMEQYDVQINPSWTPRKVVHSFIFQKYLQKEEEVAVAEARANKGELLYVLKSIRSEEYLLEECELYSYKYIRHCLTWGITPELTLVLLEDVLRSIPPERTVHCPEEAENEGDEGKTISSWDLDSTLRIKVDNVTGKRAPAHSKLKTMNVIAGIYHGSTLLCKTVSTAKYGWHQPMTIDIRLPDLPRAAKICFSLCSAKKSVKYWVNIQLFDRNRRLISGPHRLSMWRDTESMSIKHNTVPLGITGCNPDCSFPTLEMEIISPANNTIVFPSDEHIQELIRQQNSLKTSLKKDKVVVQMEKDINQILKHDILTKIKKPDRDYLWTNREQCMTKPKSLPKLIAKLDWSKRTDVFELYKLLTVWPTEGLTVMTALQLLDARCPDLWVERFAVECLKRHVTDEELLLYLMQMTQALKFRSYIDGPLTRFLLRKCLLNKRLGKQFFWHLRSELYLETIRLRFAPILEVYCGNCGPFLSDHLKEVGVFNVSCRLAKWIKSKDRQMNLNVNDLREQLENKSESKVLSNTPSIVGQPQQLGQICPEKCGIFTSKTRPLRLTWNNSSPFATVLRAEHFSYIFKDGDDIRQDMLCIQLLQVIDKIWKYEGLDCCLTPYGCMSMSSGVGIIEMVLNSKTIANIQSERGRYIRFNTGLNGWLHENNRDCYERAVKIFTHSCAGYTVATFVLGISDRHSDNIMVKNTGELFHIDFGHFLGNRKSKFGIKRERVPFVMVKDFIKVITKGVDKPHESDYYKEFVLLCIKAYLSLWKNADQLITPLYLMRNSGLPELTKSKDIQFVRHALAVDKDEIKAASYFLENFNNAYNDSWTTEIDWIMHAINQFKLSK